MTKEKECNNCGAEYKLTYDEDQFGSDVDEPRFCCFCGTEIEEYLYDDDLEELDFED